MSEEENKKVEEVEKKAEEPSQDVCHEKTEIPIYDFKPSSDEKAIIPLTTTIAPEHEKKKKVSGYPLDRDAELARLQQEKKLALVKAWEESEKTKAENKACKKLSEIESWENTKKASIEAELRKYEEMLEKKKAEYAEKMKNKAAEIHKIAEEKRAVVEAQKGELMLKAEENAAKFRATGHVPNKCFGCF